MRRNPPSLLFAFLLIGIGVLLLLQQADVIRDDLSLWPIILIAVGVVLLVERSLSGGSASGYILPLVIIAIGAGSLLEDLGTFEGDDVLVPLIAIAVGVGLVLGALPSGGSSRAEHAEVELAGAARARVEIDHGAGELRIGGHPSGVHLIEGTFEGGVDVDERREGELLTVTLKAGSAWMRGRRADWSIEFARRVPLELVLKTGASRTEADLSDLQVESLRIDTGASSTNVTLPSAGRPQVRIHAGAAEIRVSIPAQMAARIEVRGGLSDVRVDERRFPRDGGAYRSSDYDEAPNRADIVVEAGAAGVTVS